MIVGCAIYIIALNLVNLQCTTLLELCLSKGLSGADKGQAHKAAFSSTLDKHKRLCMHHHARSLCKLYLSWQQDNLDACSSSFRYNDSIILMCKVQKKQRYNS